MYFKNDQVKVNFTQIIHTFNVKKKRTATAIIYFK